MGELRWGFSAVLAWKTAKVNFSSFQLLDTLPFLQETRKVRKQSRTPNRAQYSRAARASPIEYSQHKLLMRGLAQPRQVTPPSEVYPWPGALKGNQPALPPVSLQQETTPPARFLRAGGASTGGRYTGGCYTRGH